MKPTLVLLAPELRRGRGLGHFARCLDAVRYNPDRYRLHVPDPAHPDYRSKEELTALEGLEDRLIEQRIAPWDEYSVLVLDRQEAQVADVPTEIPTVGIDLGGPARSLVDYLIDTLETLPDLGTPNLLAPTLRPQPTRRRPEPPECIHRVLLTFGGEDPADLTSVLAGALGTDRRFSDWEVTLVRGPANSRAFPSGFATIDSPPDLRNLLWEYDLVITSFGLTAHEARSAGVPVITFNPTQYHQKLSKRADFPSIGVRRPRLSELKRLAIRPSLLAEPSRSGVGAPRAWPDGLSRLLDDLGLTEPARSPVTGEAHNHVVERFSRRTYFRCRSTGLIFLKSFEIEPTEYDHDYFFDDYAAQYGRTYLEDFAHIRAMAGPRLARIAALCRRGSLLDVGCAFGPFLDAAREAGYNGFGVDVSAEAVSHVNDVLGIRATFGGFQSFVPECSFDRSTFDVVTMWYVIEHFPDIASILRRVNALLTVGGVFALSTPNAAGISGRRSLRGFLANGPRDHFTVWSPYTARKVLRRFGFNVSSIRVTGHHPERLGSLFAGGRTIGNACGSVISRSLGLGDTFEVYATKTRECSCE